ncbi:aldo/keto reductase [Dermatobacter hominis]|uniref:aldo/keto reductase n=1 Tax=Dermatobacter hominis TaxID=2884263 RepID=UPI001D12C2D5|nr:aldo/keto reductase [Dermatobacter hominis]UDY35189.1 aldo/keto reductase [Dermatobacter hominis]
MADAPALRRLGESGLVVGPIAYGCWRLAEGDVAAAREKVLAAVDCGWTLVDTADIYGWDGSRGFGDAERILGEVLAAEPGLRDRIVLATKGGIRPGVPYDWSAEHLRAACEDSLRRLGVDVIDLYQLHRPDVLTHPEEVAGALEDLVARGLVRELGVSNVTTSQLDLLSRFLDRPLATTQPELSAWHSDPVRDGTLDQCLARTITPLAWSPLGGGRVAAGDDPVAEVLGRIAGDRGVDPSSVALAFVLRHPAAPIPILGTQQVARIRRAAEALDVELSRAEWYALYQAGTGQRLP